jgi:branched-chain amino acid transport system substrate-binding protein
VAINADEGAGMPALIRQARQSRVPGALVAAVGTVAPSVIEVAGEAADGLMGADIYFPQVEPFASNAANQRFVARSQELHKLMPDKFMALGAGVAADLGDGGQRAEDAGPRGDRQAHPRRVVQGHDHGRRDFEPNGQLQSRHSLFTVQGQKIVVQK